MSNPLLRFNGLPPFRQIKPEHVVPAIEQLLADSREQVETLLNANTRYTWDNLVQPLEEIDDRINRSWSPVSHLNAVVNSPELRDAYNACLPLLSAYATEMGQNAGLFKAFRQIADSAEYAGFDAAQKKIIDNALRDFRLSGIDLPPEQQKRFKDIQEELSSLTAKFDANLLDATQGWTHQLRDEAKLQGLPPYAVTMAREAAEQRALDGWVFTLEFPSYYAVMTYADNAELRRAMYEAYTTRASDQGPNAGRWDNSENMEHILRLRHEIARLLGYGNYAERSLATKMAKSTDKVMAFLKDLANRSLGMAQEEYNELTAFAKRDSGKDKLDPWDISYFSEKLRQDKYAISQQDLKPYFPAPRVVNGLFAVVKRLYGLDIREVHDVETWHKDVRFFEIHDRKGTLRGRFYLDLYARQNKRGGAWMDDCISRKRRRDGGIQTPVAYLTCNFTPPVGGDPALLTHDEVITLFHEFGHGLHHMLTTVDYLGVSGISGVPWDAVELPSQFLENWCWEREALDVLAAHYQTGAALPEALFKKMLAAKNFQSGMQMVRQLEFSLFDFRLHLEYKPELGARIQEILEEVRAEVAVVKPPVYNRFQHSFSHIFAGGYAAGYYSYKWAEVLSSDAFSKFEETGIFNQQTGLEFLQTILEQGGARDPMDLFIEFRGREPDISALLRHSGIAA